MKNTRWCKVVSFCWLLLGLFYNPVIVAGGDPAASTLLPVDAATMGKVEQRDLQKPNLLLIVLDDAGYSDVKGFGRNDAPTPHLEQLANEGVRFTRHYADATCRPARISLMTGQQASR
ncbi:MAG: sulfatase-like hydrolase/transferase, partial [Pseudomonadales bacterium]|nr:sulfatase-like hydrolase/transferase [Pseudomonadales bacterium]